MDLTILNSDNDNNRYVITIEVIYSKSTKDIKKFFIMSKLKKGHLTSLINL